MKHKSEDYKISAVKYYLKNKDNIRKLWSRRMRLKSLTSIMNVFIFTNIIYNIKNSIYCNNDFG